MSIKTSDFPSKPKAAVILKLAFLQFSTSLLFCLILYYCYSLWIAFSALLGGLVAASANAFFAGRLFFSKQSLAKQEDAQQLQSARQMLRYFYRSETLKILFTLAMFAICIVVINVSLIAFIIAYLVAAVLVNLLFLLIDKT